mmetsp:Transcript_20300/g.38183  ORF Transcript_20300/g.38183 Transcript_20300/m.38183 type:complete len:81 (+) Transcript_20300:394-636(+)
MQIFHAFSHFQSNEQAAEEEVVDTVVVRFLRSKKSSDVSQLPCTLFNNISFLAPLNDSLFKRALEFVKKKEVTARVVTFR